MGKKNKLLRYLVITVLLLIVFGIIGKKVGWIGGESKTLVSTEKVTRRTIIETVSASGKIQPEVEVKISSDVSGEIVELPVKEGDRVTKGQLLVKINPDIYQSALERMEATVNSSRASLENAKARLIESKSQLDKEQLTYDRSKKLHDEKLISDADWETVKSTFEVAKAEVEASNQNVSGADYGVKSSAASLKEAQDNLRKTTILAPVDGTISKLEVEKGERVVGTSQMTGTEMMVLANLNEMEVNVDVNENDIVRVNTNDTASIQVDAYMNRKFKGVVTEVANSANTVGTNVDQVTNFKVKVRLLHESYLDLIDSTKSSKSIFHPGMSATVDIMTKKAENVLSLPIAAVTTRDTSMRGKRIFGKGSEESEDMSDAKPADDSKKESETEKRDKTTEYVFAVRSSKAKLQAIKVGIQDTKYVEVKEGLKENEEVVTAPYSAISKILKDGDLVEVMKKEKLFTGGK